MNATFNIKVSIDSKNVSTSFGSEKIEDMDTNLLASVLKVFGDIQNRVKTQVVKFYGIQKQENNTPATEDEAVEAAGTQDQNETQEDNEQ